MHLLYSLFSCKRNKTQVSLWSPRFPFYFFLITNPSVIYFRHSSKTIIYQLLFTILSFKKKTRQNAMVVFRETQPMILTTDPRLLLQVLLMDERWKTLSKCTCDIMSSSPSSCSKLLTQLGRCFGARVLQFLLYNSFLYPFFLFRFIWKCIFYFVNCTVSDDVLPVSGIGLFHLRVF